MSLAKFACHGLGVVQPIDQLARDLGGFTVVGGMDPQLEQREIENQLGNAVAAHDRLVWIGHSKGAMLGYYLAQAHVQWHFALTVTVDPTCWGSNILCRQWELAPPQPGEWRPYGTFDRWINIRTSMYPGGGKLVHGHGNIEDHHFADCDHIGVIADPRVRKIIFDAVAKL